MATNFNIGVGVTPTVDQTKTQASIDRQAKNIKLKINASLNEASISNLQKSYAKLSQPTDKLKATLSQINVLNSQLGKSTSNDKLVSNYQKLNTALQSASSQMKILSNNQTMASSNFNLGTGKLTLDNRITSYLQNNSKLTSELRAKLVGLQAEIKNADKTKLDQLNKSFRSVSAEAQALSKVGDTVFSKLKKNLFSFFQFLASGTIIMTFIRSIKEAATFAIDMDTALTNINYTMDVTDSQLKKIGNSSIQMAKDLNTSAKNVLQAVTLYANANETADSILNKARPAIMLSNVTGMSGTESAKTLQSVMNQFDMSQDDLMSISDTLQGVSQNLAYDFAAGIQEISAGIQESGSVAKDAGLSLGEYSSMIGLILEQTGQSGSTIGNAMKTILSRITKASAAAGTLSEDISKAEGSLRSVGVEVRSSAGEFRDMTDIMSDLGGVWDSLDSVAQSNISFEVAGTRLTYNVCLYVQKCA